MSFVNSVSRNLELSSALLNPAVCSEVFGTSAVVGFNRAKNCERFLFFDDLYQAQLEAGTTTTTIITTTT